MLLQMRTSSADLCWFLGFRFEYFRFRGARLAGSSPVLCTKAPASPASGPELQAPHVWRPLLGLKAGEVRSDDPTRLFSFCLNWLKQRFLTTFPLSRLINVTIFFMFVLN